MIFIINLILLQTKHSLQKMTHILSKYTTITIFFYQNTHILLYHYQFINFFINHQTFNEHF